MADKPKYQCDGCKKYIDYEDMEGPGICLDCEQCGDCGCDCSVSDDESKGCSCTACDKDD